jgi:hypothetical protein
LDYSVYTRPRFGIINGNLTDPRGGGFKAKVKVNIYNVYVLLGISPASYFGLPMFRNLLSVPSSEAGCGI